MPWLLGGSADLSPSTKTRLTFDAAGDFQPDSRGGRNFHFGIREHASAAVANGMALTKLRSYWSGFLIFSDYARGAIRLSALMEIPVLHIFTHDSIGVGEDGPTHQPVEQLISLRAVPGLLVFRPADANEVVETWRVVAPLHREPAALVLSRQALPTLDRSTLGAGVGRGPGGIRPGRGEQRDPRGDPARHRLGGASRPRGPRRARVRRHRHPRREHALLGAVRPPAEDVPRRGAPAVGARHGSRSSRRRRSGGTATSATPAP